MKRRFVIVWRWTTPDETQSSMLFPCVWEKDANGKFISGSFKKLVGSEPFRYGKFQ